MKISDDESVSDISACGFRGSNDFDDLPATQPEVAGHRVRQLDTGKLGVFQFAEFLKLR